VEEGAEQKIFKFRDARQERIHQRLQLVGSGTPSYFKDICRLRDTQPLFDTTTHLASHLLREIEKSLRDVLLVFINISDKPKDDGHKWEIRQILKGVDIPDDNPIATLWLRHAPTLARRAHRDNLLPPRPADDTFQQFLDEMESVFDVVLTSFESKYLNVHAVLDTKLLIENPTNGDAKWLKVNVPNNQAALGYFIDRLNNPNWLAPLLAEGLFDRPPAPIYESEKNTTFFPPWSLSKYLIRMSKVESVDVKNLVGEILLGIESTNFIIHLDILEATCSLPDDLANQVAEKELVWLRTLRSIGHLVPDKFSDLTVYLAKLNHHVTALQIAETALGFVPAETNEISAADNYLGPDPQTRMDRWDYGQFIHKSWEPLAEADWQGSLNLFCDLLVEFLERKYPERVERAESYSYIWHHAIEYDEDGLANRLVTTIRSVAEFALASDPSRITQILETLEGYRWDVFGRIGLHLLRLYPADAQAEIRKRLLSEDNFQDVGLFHEYVLLLVGSFEGLEVVDQETMLSWIDSSAKSVEEIQEWRREFDGTEISVEDAEKSIRFAKLKWLEPLKDVLTGEWLEKYTAWTAELGTPDHPSYAIGTPQVMWGGEPAVSDVLSKLQSPEEIAKYLSTPASESPQELARELSRLVSGDPNNFIGEAERFKELAPVYVRGFLSGSQSGLNDLQEKCGQSWLTTSIG
jgi:hypothetical protein